MMRLALDQRNSFVGEVVVLERQNMNIHRIGKQLL